MKAEWILVFRQTAGLWQDPEKWKAVGTTATDDNYSVLGNLEDLRSSKTEYKLKLIYPQGADGKPLGGANTWTQTSDPMKPVGETGLTPAQKLSWNFLGLRECTSSQNGKRLTLLCSHDSASDWWFALGTAIDFGGGTIPGPKGIKVKQVELWLDGKVPFDGPVPIVQKSWGTLWLAVLFLLIPMYVAAGVVLGGGGLAAHPHYGMWVAGWALVVDGLVFSRAEVVAVRRGGKAGANERRRRSTRRGGPALLSKGEARASITLNKQDDEAAYSRVERLLADEQRRETKRRKKEAEKGGEKTRGEGGATLAGVVPGAAPGGGSWQLVK